MERQVNKLIESENIYELNALIARKSRELEQLSPVKPALLQFGDLLNGVKDIPDKGAQADYKVLVDNPHLMSVKAISNLIDMVLLRVEPEVASGLANIVENMGHVTLAVCNYLRFFAEQLDADWAARDLPKEKPIVTCLSFFADKATPDRLAQLVNALLVPFAEQSESFGCESSPSPEDREFRYLGGMCGAWFRQTSTSGRNYPHYRLRIADVLEEDSLRTEYFAERWVERLDSYPAIREIARKDYEENISKLRMVDAKLADRLAREYDSRGIANVVPSVDEEEEHSLFDLEKLLSNSTKLHAESLEKLKRTTDENRDLLIRILKLCESNAEEIRKLKHANKAYARYVQAKKMEPQEDLLEPYSGKLSELLKEYRGAIFAEIQELAGGDVNMERSAIDAATNGFVSLSNTRRTGFSTSRKTPTTGSTVTVGKKVSEMPRILSSYDLTAYGDKRITQKRIPELCDYRAVLDGDYRVCYLVDDHVPNNTRIIDPFTLKSRIEMMRSSIAPGEYGRAAGNASRVML